MKVEQYMPSFFSGFEKKQTHFENSQQLLDIDWVKNFSKNAKFHRFSISRYHYDGGSNHTLMAEYKNGFEWCVVAIIKDQDISEIDDIPEWETKYEKPPKKLC